MFKVWVLKAQEVLHNMDDLEYIHVSKVLKITAVSFTNSKVITFFFLAVLLWSVCLSMPVPVIYSPPLLSICAVLSPILLEEDCGGVGYLHRYLLFSLWKQQIQKLVYSLHGTFERLTLMHDWVEIKCLLKYCTFSSISLLWFCFFQKDDSWPFILLGSSSSAHHRLISPSSLSAALMLALLSRSLAPQSSSSPSSSRFCWFEKGGWVCINGVLSSMFMLCWAELEQSWSFEWREPLRCVSISLCSVCPCLRLLRCVQSLKPSSSSKEDWQLGTRSFWPLTNSETLSELPITQISI